MYRAARAALQLQHAALQGMPGASVLSHIIQPLPLPFAALCHISSGRLLSLKSSAALKPDKRNFNADFEITHYFPCLREQSALWQTAARPSGQQVGSALLLSHTADAEETGAGCVSVRDNALKPLLG